MPPTVPGEGPEETQDLFNKQMEECQHVKKGQMQLHDKAAEELYKKFRRQPFRVSDLA